VLSCAGPVRQRPRPVIALLVTGAALVAATWTRSTAVRALPPDFDEFAYLPAAFHYAERMAPGRWHEIPELNENQEHPPLVKLAYAAELKKSGAREPDWEQVKVGRPIPAEAEPAFLGPRAVSAVAGVLQVLLAALVSPLGALWLAFDTYHVKYTAQAYVEAIPGLFALLAVLLFERALKRRGPEGLIPSRPTLEPLPLFAAAVMVGLAAAGKYPYGVVIGLTFAPFLLLRASHRPWLLFGVAATVLLAFLAADPWLWPDPIDRLWETISFHFSYSQNEHVRRAGHPWWYQLFYLTRSTPSEWHKGVFPIGFLDMLLLPAAAIGIPATLRRRPVWAAWALVGLLFLLAWPTKWPQYTLLVRPALAVMAGLGLAWLRELVSGRRRPPEDSGLL
jgi:hypothetical protein